MLSDRQLEQLLRAGRGVDLLEEEVARPVAQIGPARSRWLRPMAWSAIAAVVLVGVTLWSLSGKSPSTGASGGQTSGMVVVNPPKATPPEDHADTIPKRESHGTVVMAIVEDDEGGLKCVKWSPAAWGSRPLSEVRSEELRAIGMTMVCSESPRRVLVVGMEGPRRETVPASDARATEVARCILNSPACGVGTFDSGRCAQAGCVGSEVNVRVESVALKQN